MRKLFFFPLIFMVALLVGWGWLAALTAAAQPLTPVPLHNLQTLTAAPPTLTRLTTGVQEKEVEPIMGELPLAQVRGRALATDAPAELQTHVVDSRDIMDCFNFTATPTVTVPPATLVNICHYLANTSADSSLFTHTLSNTVSGVLLDEYAFELLPGHVVYLIDGQMVYTNTTIHSYWTSTDAEGVPYTAVATATIVVDPTLPTLPEAAIHPPTYIGGQYQLPNTVMTTVVTIYNHGTGQLLWNQTACAEPTATWFSLNPASGSVGGYSPVTIGAVFDTTGLETGTYSTPVCFATNDPSQPILERTAFVRVLGAPTGGIDLELTLSSEPHVCGDTDTITTTANIPVTVCYSIFNGTTETISDHLIFDSLLGEFNFHYPIQAGETAQFVVDWLISETVTLTTTWFSTTDAGVILSDEDTAVINLQDVGPIAQVSPTTFNTAQLTNTVRSRLMLVENYGTGSLDWSLAGCNGTWPTWLTAAPTSGSVGWLGYDHVEFLFDSTNLQPDTYTADLCFTSNDGLGNSPITIPVSLTVLAGGTDLFTFQKGVTTNINDCSTQETLPNLPSQITVEPNTEVYYCYVLTNTSAEDAIFYHDIVDDVYGVLLTEFYFPVFPSESIVFYMPTVVTETVSSTTEWTVYTSLDYSQSQTATTTIFVEEAPEPTPTPSPTPSAPSGSAIALAVTVGLDETTCATADELTLESIPATGQSVTYCYTITNTGNVALNWHDVHDTAEGELMSAVQTPLGVGQSYTVLHTTTVHHPQAVTTTWHAYNDSRTGSQSATATDTVIISTSTTAASYTLYLPFIGR